MTTPVSQFDPAPLVRPTQVFLLLASSAAAVVWAANLVVGRGGIESGNYLVLLGAYGIASACFVVPRLRAGSFRFFDVPVFFTVLAYIRFGLVPLYFVLGGGEPSRNLRSDPDLLARALLNVMAGMVAFWAGCSCIGSKTAVQSLKRAARCATGGNSVLVWSIVVYSIAFAAKVHLLRAHLFGYTESLDLYYAHLASAQVWQTVAQLGTCALVIVAIEKYRHPADGPRRLLFYVLLVSECLWGLVSGMKGVLLLNFVVVFLVASLVQRRLRARWGLAAVLALVLLYPVYDRYRALIRGGGMDVTSLSAAGDAGSIAFSETAQGQQDLGSWLTTGARATIVRLDLLRSVGWVISDGERFPWLQTKRSWWMLPFYPFVPRFLWRSKPIENVGAKLNVAMGGDNTSGTAITYPGDLYLEFGLLGIIVGMFGLGAFGEWITSWMRRAPSKLRLFIYAGIFLNITNLEDDVFGLWTGNIKWLAILGALGWLVYGQRQRR